MTVDLGYIAGLFDGEGCVTIMGKIGNQQNIRVYFAMCDPEPIEYLQECYGGKITERKRPEGRRLIFVWFLTSSRALEFLEDILPYSLGKRKQIVEALRFPHGQMVYYRSRPMPPEVRELREEIKKNLQILKEPRFND